MWMSRVNSQIAEQFLVYLVYGFCFSAFRSLNLRLLRPRD
jgi:hypothetical protein